MAKNQFLNWGNCQKCNFTKKKLYLAFVYIFLKCLFIKIGDPYLQDYVAFVAKSKTLNRACYVMECKGGIAQDVIMTIGQAFELR